VSARIDIDLNDVSLLVRVVQTGSFSKAAKERGVPVSTVSRRVARLETSLGTRLLERTTRRLRLTDTGRTYFEHAERAVDDLAQGSHRVRELQHIPRGRVRITAPAGLSTSLSRPLASFLRKNPLVNVELDLSEQRADLLAEGFDIALRSGPIDSSDFVARKLNSSVRNLFASPAYLKARGTPRRLADLSRHDHIAMRAEGGTATWNLQRSGERQRRFVFQPRLLVNELGAARRAAIEGTGVALLLSTYCAPAVKAKQLVRILPDYEGERVDLVLLYPARRGVTAAVRACIEHLLTELQLLPHDIE
jgi:DNA-binding transcriptional LysR family regulator